ncbi:kelch domain-containing protein 1-like [Ciona intestinalis]
MGNESSSQGQQYGKKITNNVAIKWIKSSKQCVFAAREGQASAVLGGKLYLFGGVLLNTGNQDSESNELLVLDVESGVWGKEKCTGDLPSQRSGATMVAVGKKLYLFGGLSQFTGWMDDFYSYDVETKVWTQITAKDGPSPRDKLSAAVFESKIYFFGGFGPAGEDEVSAEDVLPIDDDGDDEYEDIDELQEVRNFQDAANFTWSDQLFIFDTVTEKWELKIPENVEKLPSARAAHTVTPIVGFGGQKSLFVFGGKDSKSRQNDLWRYSVEKNTWECCHTFGRQPQPRSFHAATAVGKRLIIHGGRGISDQHLSDFNIFDTETMQWLQPDVSCVSEAGDSITPPPEVGLHSLCSLNNAVVLYGGTSNLDPATGTCTQFYNDVYLLKFKDVLTGQATSEEEKENNKEQEQNVPSFLNLKQVNPTDSKPEVTSPSKTF